MSTKLPEWRPPGEVEAGLVVGAEAPHHPGEAGHQRGVVLADVGEAPGRQLHRVVHLGGLQKLKSLEVDLAPSLELGTEAGDDRPLNHGDEPRQDEPVGELQDQEAAVGGDRGRLVSVEEVRHSLELAPHDSGQRDEAGCSLDEVLGEHGGHHVTAGRQHRFVCRHLPVLQLEYDVWVELFRAGDNSLQLRSYLFRLCDCDLVNVAEMGDLCQVTSQWMELENLSKKENSLEIRKFQTYCARVKISATKSFNKCSSL